MVIDGHFFNEISTSDSDFQISCQILNHHICHIFSEGVSVLVQAMHSAEHQLIAGQSAVLASNGLGIEIEDYKKKVKNVVINNK